MCDRQSPAPTADAIIEHESGGIVLVRRRYPPPGWAIPGGFVEYGEPPWQAAIREAREETGLEVELLELFHVYGDAARDPRRHTVGTVYLARARGTPHAADDAADIGIFHAHDLPAPLAFDHARILEDYFRYRAGGGRPPPER